MDTHPVALLRAILAQPTAPFHEHHVSEEIRRLIDSIPGGAAVLRVVEDTFGNIVVDYHPPEFSIDAAPAYALVAHLDHPGFARHPVSGEWVFLGGIGKNYLDANPLTEQSHFGEFAMWNLPACEITEETADVGARIVSRACDDLVGCAAIVSVLAAACAEGWPTRFLAIFTRAEEVGFVGAVHLAKSGLIPLETVILSLECSGERPWTVSGNGPIVRVGDRLTIFDDEVVSHLCHVAAQSGIPHQRALMDGGACEATAFRLYGYRTAGLTLAMRNYHNQGPDNRVAAESVALDDYLGEVRLLCALLKSGGNNSSEATRSALRERLEARAAGHAEWV